MDPDALRLFKGINMAQSNLDRLGDDELINRFALAAKQMGAAVLDSETRRANRMYDVMRAIDAVLRLMGMNARLKLLPLLDDPDRFVRYYAVKKLLGLVPDRARSSNGITNIGLMRWLVTRV